MEKRRDIQVLRGIAILSVVLNHVQIPILSVKGGFRGVDMFFVISGYVITLSILNRQASGIRASLNFITQRIRRLYPTFFFVMLVSILILISNDWLPYTRDKLDGAAISSLFYFQNFWQLRQRFSYFEPPFMNPFTHMWSLSVEEQFYIVAAIFLALISKVKKKTDFSLKLAIVLSACSFTALRIWGENRHPFFQISSEYTGFLSPDFRAWQILLGVTGAIMTKRQSKWTRKLPKWAAASLYSLALFSTFAALFIAEPSGVLKNADFRIGIFAVVICCATTLLLWLGGLFSVKKPEMFLSKFFSKVGDRSYSLYLVHWPVVTLAPEFFNSEYLWLIIILMIIGLSEFLFQSVEWKWIIRDFSNFKVLVYAMIGQVFLLSTLLFWNQNYSPYSEIRGLPIQTMTDEVCGDFKLPFKCIEDHQSRQNIFVEGDSHALMVSHLFLDQARKNRVSISFNLNNANLPYEYYQSDDPEKENLIIFSWFSLYDPVSYSTHVKSLLDATNVSRVLVFLDTPKLAQTRLTSISRADAERTRSSDVELRKLEAGPYKDRLIIIDPLDTFCDKDLCRVKSKNKIYFADYDHLSSTGSQKLEGLFEKIFQMIKE